MEACVNHRGDVRATHHISQRRKGSVQQRQQQVTDVEIGVEPIGDFRQWCGRPWCRGVGHTTTIAWACTLSTDRRGLTRKLDGLSDELNRQPSIRWPTGGGSLGCNLPELGRLLITPDMVEEQINDLKEGRGEAEARGEVGN